MIDKVLVTGPTFNELATALTRAGLVKMLDENGYIRCGDMVIASDEVAPDFVRAARTAQAIDQMAARPLGNAVYENGSTTILSESRQDGVHLIERTEGSDPREIIVPRAAVVAVSSELIDCMVRPG